MSLESHTSPGKCLARHHAAKGHTLYADSLYGEVYCAKCADYVYSDDILEPIARSCTSGFRPGRPTQASTMTVVQKFNAQHKPNLK